MSVPTSRAVVKLLWPMVFGFPLRMSAVNDQDNTLPGSIFEARLFVRDENISRSNETCLDSSRRDIANAGRLYYILDFGTLVCSGVFKL